MMGGLMKTTSRFALATAAVGMMASGAMAADLGGNCCADLEERVAELEATTARKGNRKVSLTVYGQVNKAIMWHNSDEDDSYREGELTVYDNQAGTSRFGFRGSAKIRPDLEVGYQIEVGVNENKNTNTNNANSAFNIRHNFVYFDDSRLGRVSVGQTSQVTDGLFAINLGNTMLTQLGTDQDGYLGAAFENTFGDVYDGARRQGVYYRSPTVAGFVLGTGYSHATRSGTVTDSTDFWEIALRYAGEFNGVRIAAGIGYRNEDLVDGTENDVWLGSASTMHVPTGLFISAGYGDIDSNVATVSQQGWWLIAGIQRNFFGPGATTFYGEYGDVSFKQETFGATRSSDKADGNYWGLGIVQTIDAAAMDLYLQYRKYSLDGGEFWGPEEELVTVDSSDASVIKAGAIIRF